MPDGSKIGGISSKRNENMDIMATKILNRGKSREYIFSEIRETHLEIYTCSLLNSDNDIEKNQYIILVNLSVVYLYRNIRYASSEQPIYIWFELINLSTKTVLQVYDFSKCIALSSIGMCFIPYLLFE